MSNELTPDAPKFDLFATEVEDNLKEELAKGTFQWTNKYTKVLGVAFVVMGLLSVGTWYGHYEATKSSSTGAASSFASLRAAFAGGGFGAGAAGATTGAAAAGGFGGGTRITGTIKSVKGSTVTITLDDPTQAASLVAGDGARVTDTGAAGVGGTSTVTAGTASTPSIAPTVINGKTSASSETINPNGPLSSPATGAASGTPNRGGGAFSNPKLTSCLTKAGITLTAGARPNFQDPKTAAALQSCFAQLGITPGGGFGGGSAGGGAPAPTATK